MPTECKFELQPLNCIQCGGYVGELGTCEDFAVCSACNTKVLKARFGDKASTDVDEIFSPAEEGKFKYERAKIHRAKHSNS
jgi:hypothetical protein